MSAMISPDPLAAAYRRVLDAVDAATRAAGRAPGSAAVMAASKEQAADRIRGLLLLGHRLFGENRVQEAAGKWKPLKAEFPDARLHLIGPLQTNKVREAVALFDSIDSLDRPRLAERLAEEMARSGLRPDCLVEINIAAEPQKSGILPDEADGFIEACRELWKLPVAGLMCVPPAGGDPTPHFARLGIIAARHGLATLSMGMSGDFAQAIAAGSTCVRIGTALFGARG